VLHKIDKIRGFHILAADGEIGHVDEFLVDERDWSVRYLVVDTSNWIGGRSVLISREVVDAIDSPNRKIRAGGYRLFRSPGAQFRPWRWSPSWRPD